MPRSIIFVYFTWFSLYFHCFPCACLGLRLNAVKVQGKSRKIHENYGTWHFSDGEKILNILTCIIYQFPAICGGFYDRKLLSKGPLSWSPCAEIIGTDTSRIPKIPKIKEVWITFSTGRSCRMGLEIGAIERSRRVDSQAWCFLSSTRKIRDAVADTSRSFRENISLSLLGTGLRRRSSSSMFMFIRPHWLTTHIVHA